jgi:hypothetical protein
MMEIFAMEAKNSLRTFMTIAKAVRLVNSALVEDKYLGRSSTGPDPPHNAYRTPDFRIS